MGLCAGRPLTWKMRSTARASSALAASPYTVSVGSATTSPARSSSAARCTAAWNSAGVCVGRTSVMTACFLSTAGICPQPRAKHAKNRTQAGTIFSGGRHFETSYHRRGRGRAREGKKARDVRRLPSHAGKPALAGSSDLPKKSVLHPDETLLTLNSLRRAGCVKVCLR